MFRHARTTKKPLLFYAITTRIPRFCRHLVLHYAFATTMKITPLSSCYGSGVAFLLAAALLIHPSRAAVFPRGEVDMQDLQPHVTPRLLMQYKKHKDSLRKRDKMLMKVVNNKRKGKGKGKGYHYAEPTTPAPSVVREPSPAPSVRDGDTTVEGEATIVDLSDYPQWQEEEGYW